MYVRNVLDGILRAPSGVRDCTPIAIMQFIVDAVTSFQTFSHPLASNTRPPLCEMKKTVYSKLVSKADLTLRPNSKPNPNPNLNTNPSL